MSHGHLRKEHNCLNCGTYVHGRFCHLCGQENLEPKESFWSMLTHFFNDITHFDGKFFTTGKVLLFRPGFLSTEYVRGRRASYLHPVRMYIFTSAIFFLIFFAINDSNTDGVLKLKGDRNLTRSERDSVINVISESLQLDRTDIDLAKELLLLKDTTREMKFSDLLPYSSGGFRISTLGTEYKSMEEYDSIQAGRPPEKRDGWLKRTWNKRIITLNEKNKNDRSSIKSLGQYIFHLLPYFLFVSLPFFALLLKLLYIRRKSYYYADHGIFSVHLYIFNFLILLFIFLLDKLRDMTGWGIWGTLIVITILTWIFYFFMAMKNFYRQGFGKTLVKFILLVSLGFAMATVLFLIFSLFAIFKM